MFDIGQKIKEERERRKISQQKLADALGWKHHQVVGQVENGDREVKAWELNEIAKFLKVKLDVLLGQKEADPEPYVLWRQKPSHNVKIFEAKFINQCHNYSWIEELVSSESTCWISEELPRKAINLSNFTLDEAYHLSENIREKMGLGDFPANNLITVLEERFGLRFIIDEEVESSAACSRFSKGCFIMINGKNAEVRQNFSIAHELFHLITWNEELLKTVDQNDYLNKFNETLANAFAAGLLIPKEKLQTEQMRICKKNIGIVEVIALADQFQVSHEAMLYRLLNAKLITDSELKELKPLMPSQVLSKTSRQEISRRLKTKYIRLIYLAYQSMKISRAKAAALLDIDLCELSDYFNEYGFVEIE